MKTLKPYPQIPAVDGRHRRLAAPVPLDRDNHSQATCTSSEPNNSCSGAAAWCPRHQPHNYAQVVATHRAPGPAVVGQVA